MTTTTTIYTTTAFTTTTTTIATTSISVFMTIMMILHFEYQYQDSFYTTTTVNTIVAT